MGAAFSPAPSRAQGGQSSRPEPLMRGGNTATRASPQAEGMPRSVLVPLGAHPSLIPAWFVLPQPPPGPVRSLEEQLGSDSSQNSNPGGCSRPVLAPLVPGCARLSRGPQAPQAGPASGPASARQPCQPSRPSPCPSWGCPGR